MECSGDSCCVDMVKRAAEIQEAASEFVTDTYEELVEKSSSENPDVRFLAAVRLGYAEDSRAFPILIRLMDDPYARVRSATTRGLGHFADDRVRDVLLSHLKNDSSGNVRAMCASSLGSIGGADEAIIEALNDPDWHVKIIASSTLGRLKNRDAAPNLTRQLDDPRWDVRYFACTALIDIGVSSDKVIKTLTGLRDIPEAVQTLAIFAESDIYMMACEKFGDELDELNDLLQQSMLPDDTVRILRERHGEEAVPFPRPDPIGDLIDQARKLSDEPDES